MELKLSIIIPCYNVENYVELCLQSILSLELSKEEYEVICYNDCSSDGTAQILRLYSNKYCNIQTISGNKNIGPGGGRNNALKYAHGEYIWFVDADDLIIPQNVPNILDVAIKNNVDVLAFNYEMLNEQQEVTLRPQVFNDTPVMNGIDFVSQIFYKDLIAHMGYPWRFLVRKDFLNSNNILFPEDIHYGEDTIWMPKIMLWAHKIMGTMAFCYQYWQHDNSTCGQLNHIYPGRLMYERCVATSKIVLNFVDEMKDYGNNNNWKHFTAMIKEAAKARYINQLPICLGRSSFKERTVFYNYLSQLQYDKIILKNANQLTRLLLSSKCKRILAEFVAVTYKLTHMQSHRTWV